jgi:peroxiredoxin
MSILARMNAIPTAGDDAPDFRLEDSQGRAVELSRLSGGRPLVLLFTRGALSPDCVRQLIDYRDSTLPFDRAGARIAVISPDEPSTSGYLKLERGFGFTMLADPGSGVARSWGLVAADGEVRPATFVLDRHGVVRTRAVDQRPAAQLMLSFLKRDGATARSRKKPGAASRIAAFIAALRHALRTPGVAR